MNKETLRNWVRQAEIDGGDRPGTTTDDRQRIAELEVVDAAPWAASSGELGLVQRSSTAHAACRGGAE